MRILVIGGTVFLGRAVVSEALALGADVTVFNRGVSGAPPDGVEHVRGDRTSDEDLAALRGRDFDVVVDTCGYVPAEVARSAAVLAPTSGHCAFVSSVNAFPGWPTEPDYHVGGAWDGDPDATRDDVPPDFDGAQAYGWLKVGCERAVARAFGPQRCAALRAGCIVGPDDGVVGRLAWWLDRVARGGEVLVPGPAQEGIGMIDSRDLARFALSAVPGTFECGGAHGRDTRADLMAAAADATGTEPQLTYVDPDWLLAQGVEYWTEVPLWIPAAVGPSVWRHDNTAAEAAGLRWRPLAETVADTWAWMRAVPGGWRPTERTPGLAPEREDALLAAWHARS